ncbi:MAG: HGxxPAAW family protein [Trebonia sp.]
MADQATGTVETSGGAAAVSTAHAAGPGHLPHNPGRPVSWVGTSTVIVGSIVGGVGFVPHMTWWLFWVGVAIAVLGILVLAVARTVSTDWY